MRDLKKECAEKLISLNENLSAEDKTKAIKICSRPTIEKYLRGEVVKIDVAVNLIRFFTTAVNKRIKDLESAA